MESFTDKQLDEIVSGFCSHKLDKSLWTHQAHIVTAIWHLLKYDKYDALCRLRSGIISYNLALGGENTGQSGYHETMTVFWWEIIGQFVSGKKDEPFHRLCVQFLGSPAADKNYPFRFYSKERLFSAMARAQFVEPDQEELKIYVDEIRV
jgi:hypothetical protein